MNAGTYNYYQIRYDMNKPTSSEYPSVTAMATINDSTVLNQVYSLVQQLASTYGTSRNPFRLYAIGFGPVFQGAGRQLGPDDLANHAILRGHAEQCLHRRCRRIRSSRGRTRRCRRT